MRRDQIHGKQFLFFQVFFFFVLDLGDYDAPQFPSFLSIYLMFLSFFNYHTKFTYCTPFKCVRQVGCSLFPSALLASIYAVSVKYPNPFIPITRPTMFNYLFPILSFSVSIFLKTSKLLTCTVYGILSILFLETQFSVSSSFVFTCQAIEQASLPRSGELQHFVIFFFGIPLVNYSSIYTSVYGMLFVVLLRPSCAHYAFLILIFTHYKAQESLKVESYKWCCMCVRKGKK